MRQKLLLLSTLLFIASPWRTSAFRFLFPPLPEEEYVICIDEGKADLVQTLVIVADNEPQILQREWDNKFRYFGSQPDMIYIFPSDTNHGLTCQPWIKGKQEMVVSLIPKVRLKLKAHIIYIAEEDGEDIEDAIKRIKNDCETATKIWQANYFGIAIGELTIVDDRKNKYLLDAIEFNCSKHSEKIAKTSKTEDEYIHIFYVKSVDNSECAGYSCNYPKPYCALAYWRNPNLLAHELGHSFGLHHPEIEPKELDLCRKDIAEDQCNMMWDGCESPRRHFTLGQMIQSYMNSESTLNRKCSSHDPDKNAVPLTNADMECGEIHWIPSTSFGRPDTCKIEEQAPGPDLTEMEIHLTRYLLSDCATGKTLNRQHFIEYVQQDSNAAEVLRRIIIGANRVLAITDSSQMEGIQFISGVYKSSLGIGMGRFWANARFDHYMSRDIILHQTECLQHKAWSLAIEAGIL